MDRQKWNRILVLLFCGAIAAVPLLFFLQPRQDFSEREKRYLAPAPGLSLESLGDGSFVSGLEDYVTDHFPGRELFVGINAYYELLSGRQSTKDYFLRDGRLFARPTEPDLRTMEANLAAVNDFCRDLTAGDRELPVSLMLVPSSGAVLLGEGYPDEDIIDGVYARTQARPVELMTAFRAADDPAGLYYRTDHHWTSRGAFEALCAYCRAMGRREPEREDYRRETYDPFYGSAYAAAGLWLTAPDSLELWSSGTQVQVSNENAAGHRGVFYPERLEQLDKYTVFLDGNHSLVRIENSSPRGEGGRLLVVRDSFSNCLGCFLADLYAEVILVDLRYYKLPLTELLLSEDIDEVLIECSVDNFLHDSSLTFLSVEPESLRPDGETETLPEEAPPNYFAPPPEIREEMFDNAFYLGDSVIGPLEAYCESNDKLSNALISTNAMLSLYHVVNRINKHFVYQGHLITVPEALRDMRPAVVICALGCNDLATNDLASTQESVLRFLDMVRAELPDAVIFMQSVMPIRGGTPSFTQEEVDAFNAWLKANAESCDYCYIELDTVFKDPDGELSLAYMANPTHIKPEGGALWYRELMDPDNYYHFPECFYVEYDGRTGRPVEENAAPVPAAAPTPAPTPTPEREETVLDRVYARIRTELDPPEMLQLKPRSVTALLGLEEGNYREGSFYLCANNLKADEIWLLEAADETQAQALLSRARERISTKAASYDEYLPEESRIIRQGLALRRGNYVALFLSPEAEAMGEIFLAETEE